jgi:glycosyltransferase involved in cell wall biosynthesis
MVSARAVPEKGYRVFLEALAAAGERVRGVLVGPPPRDLAAQTSALGVERQLAIEGPRERLGDYYSAFDVLAVPSTAEECMPLVILEAASVGTPTFGSRLSGIPEAIDDGVTGCLFAPRSAAELAGLIGMVERDRERARRMGHAAHERWNSQFQVESMVTSTMALYVEDGFPGGAAPGTRKTASR